MGDITREEYVGQKRELDLALEAGGLPSYPRPSSFAQPGSFGNPGALWSKATPD
jgi:hypothetical protein